MKEIQDTAQVALANGTAIGISLVEVNEILTFIIKTFIKRVFSDHFFFVMGQC